MNIKQFRERVWRGLLDLHRQYPYDAEQARVVVHPETRAMLAMETDSFEWQHAPNGGVERYQGMALELDPRINEDCILIRFEVEA